MGCICESRVKSDDPIKLLRPGQMTQSEDDNKLSINKATFVLQKKYSTMLKEYDIYEYIGKGAFGTVQKVRHKATGQFRAMKIIHKSSFTKIEQENALLKEIEILKFCNGGELFDRINQDGWLTEKLAAKIMKNILMAVAYCHSQNIMHRDLKPENILLEFASGSDRENFSIKLIDFGTSVIFKPKQKLSEKTGTPYYIAPEVMKKKYDEKCDIWSCGVILYILLSGEPPFNDVNDKKILERVEMGVVDMDIEQFKHISADAASFIRKLLTYDSSQRPSAIQALEAKWIKLQAPNSKLNEKEAAKILSRLKTFRADQKLQEATLAFIVNQLISKEETNELKKVFMELDVNNDGKLSFEEIVEGYKKIYGSANPEKDAKLIFESVDADHNGFIGYEEFIRATVDRKKILTDQKLESAFRLFDRNGDGFISANEIKEVLGKDTKLNDEIWNTIVKQVDQNGDGEISLEEFKNMMEQILNK